MYQCMIDLFAVTCILYVGQLMCITRAVVGQLFFYTCEKIYKCTTTYSSFTTKVYDLLCLRQFMYITILFFVKTYVHDKL